jgi:hypothetical protein
MKERAEENGKVVIKYGNTNQRPNPKSKVPDWGI